MLKRLVALVEADDRGRVEDCELGFRAIVEGRPGFTERLLHSRGIRDVDLAEVNLGCGPFEEVLADRPAYVEYPDTARVFSARDEV